MIKIMDGVSFGRVDDEGFVTNKYNDAAVTMDEQSIDIWNMIIKGYSVEAIIEYYCCLYPSQSDEIRQDISDFIETLKIGNIIETEA